MAEVISLPTPTPHDAAESNLKPGPLQRHQQWEKKHVQDQRSDHLMHGGRCGVKSKKHAFIASHVSNSGHDCDDDSYSSGPKQQKRIAKVEIIGATNTRKPLRFAKTRSLAAEVPPASLKAASLKGSVASNVPHPPVDDRVSHAHKRMPLSVRFKNDAPLSSKLVTPASMASHNQHGSVTVATSDVGPSRSLIDSVKGENQRLLDLALDVKQGIEQFNSTYSQLLEKAIGSTIAIEDRVTTEPTNSHMSPSISHMHATPLTATMMEPSRPSMPLVQALVTDDAAENVLGSSCLRLQTTADDIAEEANSDESSVSDYRDDVLSTRSDIDDDVDSAFTAQQLAIIGYNHHPTKPNMNIVDSSHSPLLGLNVPDDNSIYQSELFIPLVTIHPEENYKWLPPKLTEAPSTKLLQRMALYESTYRTMANAHLPIPTQSHQDEELMAYLQGSQAASRTLSTRRADLGAHVNLNLAESMLHTLSSDINHQNQSLQQPFIEKSGMISRDVKAALGLDRKKVTTKKFGTAYNPQLAQTMQTVGVKQTSPSKSVAVSLDEIEHMLQIFAMEQSAAQQESIQPPAQPIAKVHKSHRTNNSSPPKPKPFRFGHLKAVPAVGTEKGQLSENANPHPGLIVPPKATIESPPSLSIAKENRLVCEPQSPTMAHNNGHRNQSALTMYRSIKSLKTAFARLRKELPPSMWARCDDVLNEIAYVQPILREMMEAEDALVTSDDCSDFNATEQAILSMQEFVQRASGLLRLHRQPVTALIHDTETNQETQILASPPRQQQPPPNKGRAIGPEEERRQERESRVAYYEALKAEKLRQQQHERQIILDDYNRTRQRRTRQVRTASPSSPSSPKPKPQPQHRPHTVKRDVQLTNRPVDHTAEPASIQKHTYKHKHKKIKERSLRSFVHHHRRLQTQSAEASSQVHITMSAAEAQQQQRRERRFDQPTQSSSRHHIDRSRHASAQSNEARANVSGESMFMMMPLFVPAFRRPASLS